MNGVFYRLGANCYLDPRADIRSPGRISLGDRVQILTDCWLNTVEPEAGEGPKIIIGDGSQIGRRSTISAVNLIRIGKNVLFGPNVLVMDHNHRYDQVGTPILAQGIDCKTNRVLIDDDAWLGANVVVVGNVHIGRGAVIGANAVVIRDVPDYTVAVGNPARIVKAWDARTGRFETVASPEALGDILAHRPEKPLIAGPEAPENAPDQEVLPFTALSSLQVEISSACNLRCPQCFNRIKSHHTALMSYAFFQERIQPHLGKLKAIHLVGIGEPLVHPEFFRFVKACVDAGVTVFTTSNLQLVTPPVAERLVSSGISELSFSCDGAQAQTYESIRRGGTWDQFKKALTLINEAKARLKSDLPHLTLNFGALRRNIEELPAVVELAAQSGVGLIIAYHVVHYTSELADESLFHYQGLSDQYFLQAQQVANRLGVRFFMPGLFMAPIDYHPKAGEPFCIYPFNHLYIYADGRVGPCCMDFPDRMILGDLNRDSLEAVWNGGPIQALRRAMLAHQPNETCQFCVLHGRMNISDPRFLFRFPGSAEYLAAKYGTGSRSHA